MVMVLVWYGRRVYTCASPIPLYITLLVFSLLSNSLFIMFFSCGLREMNTNIFNYLHLAQVSPSQINNSTKLF